MTFPVTSMLHT